MNEDETQRRVRGLALCAAAKNLDLQGIERMLGGDGLPAPDLDCRDADENPPIALACESDEPESLVLPVVKRLLDAGFDVNDCNYSVGADEYTPLMMAVRVDRIELAQLLMAHDADPTMIDRYRDTVLNHAISSEMETLQAVIHMIKRHLGAEEFVEFAKRGTGVLHEAARIGHEEAIDVLLREGVELEGLNDRGETPLMMVASNCNDVHGAQGLMQLVRLGAQVTPNIWLSRAGVDLESPRRFSPPEGMWALMLAVEPEQWPAFSQDDAYFSPDVPLTRLAAAMHLGDVDILLELTNQVDDFEGIAQMQREAQLVHQASSGQGRSRRVPDAFAMLGARLSQKLIGHIGKTRGLNPA